MGIIMNMSSYEIERDSAETEYDEEVLYAGWNPSVPLLSPHQFYGATHNQEAGSICLAQENVDLFLDRIYANQR